MKYPLPLELGPGIAGVVVNIVSYLDYRNVVGATPLGQRFPEHDTVEDIVKATLIDKDSFSVVAQMKSSGR